MSWSATAKQEPLRSFRALKGSRGLHISRFPLKDAFPSDKSFVEKAVFLYLPGVLWHLPTQTVKQEMVDLRVLEEDCSHLIFVSKNMGDLSALAAFIFYKPPSRSNLRLTENRKNC